MRLTNEPSHQQLSDLIGMIYDCAIEPERWGPTLDSLRDLTNCLNAAFAVQTVPTGRILLFVTSNIEPHLLATMGDYGPDVVDQWGGIETMMNAPFEEPAVLSWTRPRHLWENNRYFAEWARPQGIIDVLGITVARDAHAFGTVGMGRHESAGPVTTRDVDALRFIVPHFQRAISISRTLDLKTIVAHDFRAALDALAAGAVLVDADMRIVHANAAADAMLISEDPIFSEAGMLSLKARPSQPALAAAVAEASRDEASTGRRGFGIPVRRDNGDPAVLHVLPLRHGALRPGLMPGASAAIFIAPSTTPRPASDQVLAALFDLTPTEARVFGLIGAGHSLELSAQMLKIERSTAKTHLQHLFAKTGARRQADLVKLAASLNAHG